MKRRRSTVVLATLLSLAGVAGCAQRDERPEPRALPGAPPEAREPVPAPPTRAAPLSPPPSVASAVVPISPPSTRSPIALAPVSPPVIAPRRIGRLGDPRLLETSGLAASIIEPGALWALNDGGNEARLFALDLAGDALGSWPVAVPDRDWEDLASGIVAGRPSLIVADTGDNGRRRESLTIHLVDEPGLGDPPGGEATLAPWRSIELRFEDGPHDVEALAFADGAFWMLSKEPASAGGARAAGIYRLAMPPSHAAGVQVARRVGTMARARAGVAARLALALAGVDLDAPTALDIDEDRGVAWLLTYHEVLRFDRRGDEPWSATLARAGRRVHSHDLAQAEALAVLADGLVVFTSEGSAAPLVALPGSN